MLSCALLLLLQECNSIFGAGGTSCEVYIGVYGFNSNTTFSIVGAYSVRC
jgi:hypothetical protein